MTSDTKIGGSSGQFPITRWSAILAARSKDSGERSRGLEGIAAAYWKPIYKYFRLRWGKSNEDAKDLTQEFFTRVVEKEFLNSFDPTKARLRTFLRLCADRFLANDFKASKRLKRGGGVQHVSFDFGAAEAELSWTKTSLSGAATPHAMDDFLEKEFIRSLFGLAVENLREFCAGRGKEAHFQLFEAYDLAAEESDRAGYAELARKFGIATTDVTNYLAFARREFRRIALEKLWEMTASDAEFRCEARALLGVEPE